MGPASGSNLKAWAMAANKNTVSTAAGKPPGRRFSMGGDDDEDSAEEELEWMKQRNQMRSSPHGGTLAQSMSNVTLPSMKESGARGGGLSAAGRGGDSESGSDD